MVVYISVGTLAMMVLSLIRHKGYVIPLWKSLLFSVMLTISGVSGTLILAYIETGRWGGVSFYGSVLLIPLLLILISLVLRMPYAKLADFSVPQICIMLAVMKVNCFNSGCCGGIQIFAETSETMIFFPSQIVEMINALILMVVIIIIDKKIKYHGSLYGIFMILYGITRFILNFFRSGLTPFVWEIPAGHFWSIVSIAIGIIWVVVAHRKRIEVSDI